MKVPDSLILPYINSSLHPKDIGAQLGLTASTVRYRLKRLKLKANKLAPALAELSLPTDSLDCKVPLTKQESLFLDLHLIEKQGIDDAMVQAGYGHLPERTRYYQAQKLLQKYEVRAEDHRHIMRAVGAGEVRVITHLWHLAQKAGSDTAKVAATTTLGKWLGMDKDQVSGAAGVTINIQAHQGSPTQVNVGAPGPTSPTEPGSVTVSYQHPTAAPGKPIQITE